jgi:hypothetical protein
MQDQNLPLPARRGNNHRGESAALPNDRLQTLHADLLALADSYVGYGRIDTLRLASQIERKLARAGAP